MSVREAFLYAARGWHVFPVKLDKTPRTLNGLNDATTDRDRLREWWRRWPEAGIGIATGPSGLLVLDVDGDHGTDSLHDLEREHGELPETVRAKTGGGGIHHYFASNGTPIRNSAGRLGTGLDIRGVGGYVLAPPSPHSSGRRYEWDVAPGEASVAEPPAWLLEQLQATQRQDGQAPPVGNLIPAGERNERLSSLAGSMRRRGLDAEEMLEALRKVNERRCTPPLPDEEVAAIAASIARYEPAAWSPTDTPPQASPEEAGPEGRRLTITPASAIRSERVRWGWRDRGPLGGLTVIAGEKGLGKSILTNARLAAAVTRGELEGEYEGKPADVLIATAEDSWSAVIKPRLMAHGADLDRVHRVEVLDEEGRSLLTLPDDAGLFEREVEQLRAAGREVAMLVIDPIGAFLATTVDSHKDAHVRRALAPLADLAEQLDIAVLVVAHLTKDEGRRLIARVHGAAAFVNAARSVLALARHPDDAEGEQGHRRVLAHVASNWGRYAPSLAVHVEAREIDVDDGSTTEVGYLVLDGETTVGVEDLQRESNEDGSDRRDAIIAALKGGPRPSREVKREVASELACSRKTVERTAMEMEKDGELRAELDGFPATSTWRLLSRDTPVGTTRHTVGVPTEQTALESRVPVPAGDSWDSRDVSPAGVPTGAQRRACASHAPDPSPNCRYCRGDRG